MKPIKDIILEKIADSPERLTPAVIQKELARLHGFRKRSVAVAIHELVAERFLVYTNQFGCTFLECSYNKPVRIGPGLTVKPADLSYQPAGGEIVINMAPGAAFGSGEHPTTRLALRGLSYALAKRPPDAQACMLDVGTGSGILAIAAVRMGIGSGLGLDIDPCARVEAEKNARLNGLAPRIRIAEVLEKPVTDRFSLVTANLRTPTLKQLKPMLTGCIRDPGIIVMSGIKTDEVAGIKAVYKASRLSCQWEESEKNWAGLVFFRP